MSDARDHIAAGLPAIRDWRSKARRASPPLFVLFLALWTWKLLEPQPVPESLRGELGVDWAFFLAKTLHGGAYAFLMVLGAFAFPRHQWWVFGFLLLHGVGSEIGQTFVPNRHGCVRDVLIDWAGIAGGCVVMWRATRRKPAG
jgi:VanZ family protein